MGKNIYIGDSNNLARKVSDVYVGTSEEYKVLTYIENSGTEWINSLVYPYRTKIEMQIQEPDLTAVTRGGYFAGCWQADNNRYYPLQIQYVSSSSLNFRTANRSNTYTTLQSCDTNIHTIIYNDENNRVYWDNVQKASVSDLTIDSNTALGIFCSSSGGEIIEGGRIYYCKITNKTTNTLIRDFVPVKHVGTNEIGLYDKVEGKFYQNQGTGSFTGGSETGETITQAVNNKKVIKAYIGDSNNLARECYDFTYTPVEYLRSSGTQWINTGIKALKTRTELRFKLPTTPTSSSWVYFAGAYGDNDNRYYVCGLDSTRNIVCQDKSGTKITLMSGNDTNIHSVLYNNLTNKVFFDGVLKGTISDLTEETVNPISLFCRDTLTAPPQALDIYYCRITDLNTMKTVRDMIPVLDSNNIPCMYDKISKRFFYNQGTGTFNYG